MTEATSAPTQPAPLGADTADTDYADRLTGLQGKWWKRVLPVQAPYRFNIARLRLGRTLDVGCGSGRMLAFLPKGSVGVDHNPYLVSAVRAKGLDAYTTVEFFSEPRLALPRSFDAILAAHLVEHLRPDEARYVLDGYLPMLRQGGRLVLITPQERGHASDPTHVEFTDFDALRALADDLGLQAARQYSFPFPRWAGKVFIYNEFNLIASKGTAS